MGIGYLGAKMLWNARQRGVSFGETLTLAHLSLRLFPGQVSSLRDVYRDEYEQDETPLDDYHWGHYVDGFLRDYLGASTISVLDASPYQGADLIHDMNFPVPLEWHNRFDAVIDGGSLEHIFNVPNALSNLANMLKVGGSIFVNAPANNLMGHGFYQFSPELMFRVFSEANGFRINNIYMYEASYPSVELTKNEILYQVVDPESARKRVGLQNKKPVMMMVEATKTSNKNIFETAPLQSDYVAAWSSETEVDGLGWRKRVGAVVAALPLALSAPIRGYREKRIYSLRNKEFYTRQRW